MYLMWCWVGWPPTLICLQLKGLQEDKAFNTKTKKVSANWDELVTLIMNHFTQASLPQNSIILLKVFMHIFIMSIKLQTLSLQGSSFIHLISPPSNTLWCKAHRWYKVNVCWLNGLVNGCAVLSHLKMQNKFLLPMWYFMFWILCSI